jgi:hypothetical protein
MKRLLHTIEDMFAATALAEWGLTEAAREMVRTTTAADNAGNVEEISAAAAFAESGEYETARELSARRWGKTRELEVTHPDDCQYGDNDLCFVQS